ncbi:MAG: hypothetical protein LC731_01485 [Acidobacteria bacterium]|nr:hypothetical protein [Acidobacteriota bacterium]
MSKTLEKERVKEMGVIGRLDDQVNEIIIKPVGERKRQESEEATAPSSKSGPLIKSPAEKSPVQDEASAQEPRAQSELPVWLL